MALSNVFNSGFNVPMGRGGIFNRILALKCRAIVNRPCGTWNGLGFDVCPGVETPGYFRQVSTGQNVVRGAASVSARRPRPGVDGGRWGRRA